MSASGPSGPLVEFIKRVGENSYCFFLLLSLFYLLPELVRLLLDLWRDLQEKDCIIQHNH